MKIFYSWQSDRPSKTNRYLIQNALQEALQKVATQLEIEKAERPELDHDTKGMAGSPNITEAIFSKIDNCFAFVGDVTPVGLSDTGRALMNPNVAIELGYALARVTTTRLLMVMNTAYGSPDDLPFDLRHKRWPIRYELADDADSTQRKAAQIKLVAELKAALQALIEARPLAPQEPFREQPIRARRALYFDDNEVFALGYPQFTDKPREFRYQSKKFLYVRVLPTIKLEALAINKLRTILNGPGQIKPFPPDSHRFHEGRNAYGSVLLDINAVTGTVLSSTQLFPSRELWGLDALMFSKTAKTYPTNEDVPAVSIKHLERVVRHTVKSYCQFADRILRIPCPINIEVGASGISGYYMLLPQGYIPSLRGRIIEDEIHKRLELSNYSDQEIDSALLNIYEEFWSHFGEKRPPDFDKNF